MGDGEGAHGAAQAARHAGTAGEGSDPPGGGDGPEAVRAYWIDEVGQVGWYDVDPERDAEIAARFGALWERAAEGGLRDWLCDPFDALAYLILTDQFPRNLWRGSARAFSTDRIALTAAKAAIDRDWDLRTREPERQFFYLPLMHSERLTDQDRCVRLVRDRMPDTGAATLLHAKAHREVIRRFGRFPYRNAALGRSTNAAEQAFLDQGSYGGLLRQMKGD